MLMNMAKLLRKAKEGHYGIIASCPLVLEEIHYAFIAADEMASPVIICCNPAVNRSQMDNYENYSPEIIGRTVKHYAEKYPHVDCALCLDHGDSLEYAVRAIKAGYTGVMVDKSMCDDETNIQEMCRVVKVAHAADVGVEAGLGGTPWRDPTLEEIKAHLTDVDTMMRLVEESGVDVVAVSVGGSHGDHKTGDAVIYYDLIEKLRDCSNAILCNHGSSQTGDEKLAKGAKCGLSKFNVAGDLLIGAVKGFLAYYNEGNYTEERGVANMFKALKRGYIEREKEFMSFLGSAGKLGKEDA